MADGAGWAPPDNGLCMRRCDPDSHPSQPASARQAIENAILDEGRAARLALARRTAQEALLNPGAITARRLNRLGPDGLSRFIEEMRLGARSTLGQSVPQSRERTARANPDGTQPPRYAKPSVARIEGWWRTCREGAPGFEARARRWGYATGAVLAAICVALLRQTKF